MNLSEEIERIAKSIFSETGYVDTGKLVFYPEVRQICEQNGCRRYGTTWACPPAIGTLDECRARVEPYDRMLLLAKKYELEDSFDYEGMMEGMRDFRDAADEFDRRIRGLLTDFLLLANESCGRCTKCTYPDAPCRFPEQLHPSLEGYGFVVNELAREAGVRYNNGPATVTYFGGLFFHSRG